MEGQACVVTLHSAVELHIASGFGSKYAALVLDQAPIGGALVELDGRIAQANGALCALTGFSRNTLETMSIRDLTHPDDLDADAHPPDGLLTGELTSYHVQARLITAAGTELPVIHSVSLCRSDLGSPLFFILQVSDLRERLRSVTALEEECRRLRQAQSIGRVGSWEYDIVSGEYTISDSARELLGLGQQPFTDTVAAVQQCLHVDDSDAVIAATDVLRDTGEAMSMRHRVIRANDGAQRWFDARGVLVRDSVGRPTRLIGTMADVSELVQAELDVRLAHAELSQAHSYQQAVITASPDAIHIYDVASQSLSRANRSGKEFIGYTEETIAVMSGLRLEQLVPADDLRRLQEILTAAQALRDGEVVQLRHRILHAEGGIRWLSRRMTPFQRSDHGEVQQVLVVSWDVTDVVAVEERLEHAALHDELTGLPNRRLVRDRLALSLRRAARGGHIVAMVCDLDGFKRINDSHGHLTGDSVLCETATRLVHATRAGDTVARMGGDEFVVVLDVPETEDPRALAKTVAKRIESALAEPILIDSDTHIFTVSIGICVANEDATAETILRDADTAMYHVKNHGANGHTVFEPALRQDRLGLDHTERQIRRALTENSVELYYQPIVDPATNTFHGVEALVRIADVDGTHLNTAQVIAVAEQTELISALDDRVLQIACEQAAAWRREPEYAHLTLTLNRSAKDISKPGFYNRVNEILTKSGLDPHALTLEITETVLLDADQAALADLRRLHDQGVGIAIDDFGTGYASLRYLTVLPITCIKIDRSFTKGLPDDRTCLTLVRATVGIAEDLEIHCVVEGVETPEQLGALPRYDGLLIQGYLYGRPQPAAAALRGFGSAGLQ
jgi:diguanylate cyclase (GGDEF)-like protein/PAS domain S-box-containing protein